MKNPLLLHRFARCPLRNRRVGVWRDVNEEGEMHAACGVLFNGSQNGLVSPQPCACGVTRFDDVTSLLPTGPLFQCVEFHTKGEVICRVSQLVSSFDLGSVSVYPYYPP